MPYVSPCAIARSSHSDLERVVRDGGRTLGWTPLKRHLAVVRRGDSVADQRGIERSLGAHDRPKRRPEVAVLTLIDGCFDLFPVLSARFMVS